MKKSLVKWLAIAAALAGADAAVAQDGATQPAEAPSAAAQLIANCNAHKFETTIQTVTAGKPHTSKVKLCGKVGQSDADWLLTLKDALQTVEANPKMPPEVKVQIAAGLQSEIARVEARTAAPAVVAPAGPVAVPPAPALPSPPTAPPRTVKPRLSFECYTPGDIGSGGPCTTLTRDTRITVRAGGDVLSGYALRFVSRGESKGEIALQPMTKGRSMRVRLPDGVCAGGGAGNVELALVGGGATLDTWGPFILRC